jgi:chaperonin GroEL
MLGQAQKVEITKDTTTVIGGCGDKAALDVRVRELRAQVERSRSDYDREKLNGMPPVSWTRLLCGQRGCA